MSHGSANIPAASPGTVTGSETSSIFQDPGQILRLLYHTTREYFLLLDDQLRIRLYNRITWEQLRIHTGIEIYDGLSVLALSPAERQPLLLEIYSDVLAGEIRESSQDVHSTATGELRSLHNFFLPARNDAGAIIGVMIISHDVTSQKKTERALSRSEEQWRFAIEGSKLGLWDQDLISKRIYFSPSYHQLYGFPEGSLRPDTEELRGRIHPDDLPEALRAFEELISGRTPTYERTYRIRDAQDRYRWVNARGMVVSRDKAGNALRVIGTHDDVTDTREAEQALQRSNERFALATRATSDAIYDWDIVNDQIFWGEGFGHLFGHHPEAVGVSGWEELIHPDDRGRIIAGLREFFADTSQEFWKSEYRFRRADGSWSEVLDRGYVLRNEQGPYRMIGAMQDVTDQRAKEREALNRQKLISRATIETQERERAAIGKELHDNVNQVLTTTKLYLDLTMSNPELRDDLIVKASRNVIYVINEIRQLSRSLMNPSLGDLGLTDALNDLTESIRLTRKFDISLQLPEGLDEWIEEDQKLILFRIVQEAINNAVRHAAARTVEIRVAKLEQEIELIVKDDGVGFDPAHVKRGTGLRNIENRVFLANGTLIVETAPGKGCTLVIHLPLKTN